MGFEIIWRKSRPSRRVCRPKHIAGMSRVSNPSQEISWRPKPTSDMGPDCPLSCRSEGGWVRDPASGHGRPEPGVGNAQHRVLRLACCAGCGSIVVNACRKARRVDSDEALGGSHDGIYLQNLSSRRTRGFHETRRCRWRCSRCLFHATETCRVPMTLFSSH